jgi:hypothetical protein
VHVSCLPAALPVHSWCCLNFKVTLQELRSFSHHDVYPVLGHQGFIVFTHAVVLLVVRGVGVVPGRMHQQDQPRGDSAVRLQDKYRQQGGTGKELAGLTHATCVNSSHSIPWCLPVCERKLELAKHIHT